MTSQEDTNGCQLPADSDQLLPAGRTADEQESEPVGGSSGLSARPGLRYLNNQQIAPNPGTGRSRERLSPERALAADTCVHVHR